jgi:hypothetical protein
MTPPTKDPKAGNLKWLSAAVLLDAVVLVLLLAPEVVEMGSFAKTVAYRMSAAAFLPPLVFLGAALLPSNLKDVLIFWRLKDTLPGHRAFDVYARQDPRIDVTLLEKNIGPFPVAPRDQNARWYSLYKDVSGDPTIWESQRVFLLFRDLAAISIVLAIVTPGCLWLLQGHKAAAIAALLLVLQYLFTALAARHNAARFVANVLAAHSTTNARVDGALAKPKPTRKPRAAKRAAG